MDTTKKRQRRNAALHYSQLNPGLKTNNTSFLHYMEGRDCSPDFYRNPQGICLNHQQLHSDRNYFLHNLLLP